MRSLVWLVLLGAPCAAQPVSTAPWMTGARLLEMVAYPKGAKNNFDLTRAQYIDAERARSYIEGVHDATEGKSWCYSERYRPGPDALREQVEMALRTMPREQLQRNASDLIVEIWHKYWPCKNGAIVR